MARQPGRLHITSRKVGQWRDATRLMRRMNFIMPAASKEIMEFAYESRDEIRDKIRQQAFKDWPELSPAYKRQKISEGKDHRMLIARGEYLDSIKIIPLGPNAWGVGIPHGSRDSEGNSMAKIGLIHEYGGGRVPARPHWRREYARQSAELVAKLYTLLATNLRW